MAYKIIFLDIDGTLTNSEKKITDKTREALLKAADMGVILAIASGRPEKGVEYAAGELRLAENGGYILPFNGGIVRNAKTREILYENRLDLDIVRQIYPLAKQAGLNLITYKNGEVLAETLDDEYIGIEARINNMPINKVDCVIDELEECPVKCLLTGEPDKAAAAEITIREAVGGKANIFRSEPFFVEVMPCGIDKAASIEAFIAKLGIKREEVIACGDGFNDITMVKYAGLGVAMSNGCEQIRACADYVTENDNDHDGIAEVVEKFILNA